MKPESDFQDELTRIAPLYKCRIIDIPDIPPLNRYGKVLKKGEKPAISRKLPFDCLLCTPGQNFCIEFKYDNNKLLPHQEKFMQEINSINLSYFLLRKKELKKGIIYTIEHNYIYSTSFVLSCLFRTEKIEDLFMFFQHPTDQKLMMDNLISEKPKKKMKRKIIG